ncbi:permease prefix domain 1-containing protein [Kribbella sp.]|uniref:permease prefix domain 1-containing protein n=1 Tax=Kribbella sp. TaxID=1871183 RepID=UPI002D73472C|nr:permease prefix domain 1-containing protein [Kribbella sp.]HZX03342.1 permease prefix domain 1-containing protein [Kribbella sp.]
MPIDDYLAALNKALRGPRRRKADLLAEARDHLIDATEAFQADGHERYEAERAAVADFGELPDVVPGYRAELAISQSRRTAMMLLFALMIQPIVWQGGAWIWTQHAESASVVNDMLQTAVRAIGIVVIAGALLAVLATGIGVRYAVVREHLSRVTALFALAGSVTIAGIGLLMAATSNHAPGVPAFGVVGTFVVLPLVLVSIQAARGLRLARA